MASNTITFVHCDPLSGLDKYEEPSKRRDELKAELRAVFNARLEELTGIVGARISYPLDKYTRLVVIRYEVMFFEWPDDVPFLELSRIRGGIAPLERLLEHWNAGKLRLERATPEQIEKAKRDPMSVHPNPPRAQHPAAVSSGNGREERAKIVEGSAGDGDRGVSVKTLLLRLEHSPFRKRYRNVERRLEAARQSTERASEQLRDHDAIPDLEIGDLFYHRTPTAYQLWLWCKDDTGRAVWQPAHYGYRRKEDGRRLIVTKALKFPSWVTNDYYARVAHQG
ncbi:hypothetical protein NUW54_g10347 [Trametes sanguinea]|uniref:Uncharacterized protein n=1 Tax=Trametes sanguinea TaxID=158606 RepID=A0ACC1NZW0_9APHY|nr:hypothetical protein NUW54_g10347 [Trametes sanguinea]